MKERGGREQGREREGYRRCGWKGREKKRRRRKEREREGRGGREREEESFGNLLMVQTGLGCTLPAVLLPTQPM